MSETLYLLVQYAADGDEETAGRIAILDGVGSVARVRGAYDLIVRVDDEPPANGGGPTEVSDAVGAVHGVLHVVPVRVPDFLRAE
jgi:hypothetical protein